MNSRRSLLMYGFFLSSFTQKRRVEQAIQSASSLHSAWSCCHGFFQHNNNVSAGFQRKICMKMSIIACVNKNVVLIPDQDSLRILNFKTFIEAWSFPHVNFVLFINEKLIILCHCINLSYSSWRYFLKDYLVWWRFLSQ